MFRNDSVSTFQNNSAGYQASDAAIAAVNCEFVENHLNPYKIYIPSVFINNGIMKNNLVQCPRYTKITSSHSGTATFFACRPCAENTYTLSAGTMFRNDSVSTFQNNSAGYQASDAAIAAVNCEFVENHLNPYKIYIPSVFINNGIMKNNLVQCPRYTKITSSHSGTATFFACRPCAENTYTLSAGTMFRNDSVYDPKCFPCPYNAICTPTTGDIIVDAGFWCHDQNSENKLECIPCPTGYCKNYQHKWDSSCTDNRVGTLCGECKEGYTISLLGSSCIKNQSVKRSWWFLYLLIPAIYVFIFVFFDVGASAEWKSFSYVISMFPLLITTNPITLVPSFIFGFQPYLSSGGDSIIDTLWRFNFKKMNPMEKVYYQIFLSVSAPILALFGYFVLRGIRLMRKRFDTKYHSIIESEMHGEEYVFSYFPEKEKRQVPLWGKFLQGAVSLLLFHYANLVLLSVSLFRCVNLFQIDEQPYRWFSNGGITCTQPFQYVSIVLFCLFLAPFPIYIFLLRAFLRRKFRKNPVAINILHLLESAYYPKFNWWESYSQARRLAIIFVYVFVLDNFWRVVNLSLFSLFFTSIQAFIRPMRGAPVENHLETFCLGALTGACILERSDPMWNNAANYAQIILVGLAVLFCVLRSVWNRVTSTFNSVRDYFEDKGWFSAEEPKVLLLSDNELRGRAINNMNSSDDE
eukprot:TRINITY_DN4858_c0_g1_i1.p1 TRINITY_DN4858_c0_g1~~TRINITY_DN4858_c0_g1_i1.p1  ORF type:complete len:692 (+),score=149.60 TRINITY_DN4858_c0_g1_i1:2-2077(+)